MTAARIITDLDGQTGGFNMAADDFLAASLAQSNVKAVFRVYTWKPAAVSLGLNQKPEVIDQAKCRAEGWDVVRRPTGGRSLLHDGDLSYCLVLPVEKDSFTQLRRLLSGVAEALIRMLERAGITADNTQLSVRHALNDPSPRARLCMGSRSRGEVHIAGRKVSGAAQHLYRDCVLQHGSIPIIGDIGAIAMVSPLPEADRITATASLRREAATLKDIGFPFLDPAMVAEMFTREIQEQFGFDFIERDWNASEEQSIRASACQFVISESMPWTVADV